MKTGSQCAWSEGCERYVVENNYAPHTASRPWESAINAVFGSVYKDAAPETDVLDVDLDELARRFANATGDRHKAESRVVYMQRVGKAIRSYEEYLKDPNRAPNLSVRKPRASRTARENSSSRGGGGGSAASVAASPTPPGSAQRRYSFPLRNGDAELSLPREFYGADAERLIAFIQSLVFEPVREPPTVPAAPVEEA